MPVSLSDFEPLRPAERRLADWLQAGNRETCVISPGLPPEDAPEAVRLRASFVRYLALGGCDACRTHEKGLRVRGAFIESDGREGAETRGLDLEDCRLPGDLGLFACRFPDRVLLSGVEVRSIYFGGSHLADGFGANGLKAKADVFFRSVIFNGTVRLRGAKLGGDLDASYATFGAVGEGAAFSAVRMEALGGVFLRGVTAKEAVRLVGVKLGGNLDASDATFRAGGDGDAFSADGLEAKGDVFLRGVKANGDVRLRGAKLGGDLDADRATFSEVGDGVALSADQMEIGGSAYLRGTKVEGRIAFHGVQIARSFWTDAESRLTGALDLTAAQIGEIIDHPEGWPSSIALDRCRYSALVRRASVDGKSHIRWLSLEDGDDFHPQPWEECARVLREMGHGVAAREVLIAKEKRQRAARRAALRAELLFEDADFLAVWDRVLGATVRYGRQPLLAFAWLFGFWFVGAFIFASAAGQGALKPNLPQIQRAPEWVLCAVPEGEVTAAHRWRAGDTQYGCYIRQPEARSYPKFNALIYSADTLLPVVSLEMQSYWLPDEDVPPGGWVRFYLWLHIAAGWALTLLAVAGFSGLVKQDSS